ncbi:MAG: glycosyltransferase family 2 protein [Deltaproteobacteria bacterium]
MDIVNPVISVIIPSYNRSEFILRAVRSVFRQTFNNIELLVVDDGSTDDTIVLLHSLQQEDPRLQVIKHEKNLGSQAARNTGILASHGEFIAFLDSDNEWMPDKLEKQISLINVSHGNIGAVYSGFFRVHADGKPTSEQIPRFGGDIYKTALREWVADMNTLTVRKDILHKAGLLDERIRSYQEWDLCIRLAKVTEFDFVNEPLVIYHMHDKPTISKDQMLDAFGYLDVISVHRDEIIEHLGCQGYIRHLLAASIRFAEANDFKTARTLLTKSFKLSRFHQWGILTAYWILLHIGRKPYKMATQGFLKTRSFLKSRN